VAAPPACRGGRGRGPPRRSRGSAPGPFPAIGRPGPAARTGRTGMWFPGLRRVGPARTAAAPSRPVLGRPRPAARTRAPAPVREGCRHRRALAALPIGPRPRCLRGRQLPPRPRA
jgi:hypothetical protein